MLTIHRLDTSEAIALFPGTPALADLTPAQRRAFCEERGLLAFAAEQGGDLVGLAVAESHPNVVHILNLEGSADACRLLLERLVRLAGERDLSGWCPVARTELGELLEERGFSRQHRGDFQGRPSHFYRWRRNEGV